MARPPSPPPPPATARRRWAIRLAVAAGLVAIYALLGFAVAPRILKGKLQEEAARALAREVRIEEVAVNPFALSVTIRGFSVKDLDGAPLAGFGRLYVRLAPWAVLSREIGLAEVRLVRPAVRLALRPDGKPSFQDLLDRPAAPEAAPAGQRKPGWGLYVGLLSIEEASLAFVDGTLSPPFTKELGPLSFRLERFHTRPGTTSAYSFRGATDSGEAFSWEGRLGASPPGATGTVRLERLRLDRYRPYTSEQAPAEIRAGLATLAAGYQVEWGPERKVLRISDASLSVEGLRVGRPGVAGDDLSLPALSVTGVQVDVLGRRAQVAEVALHGGTIRALRDAGGALNLAQLAGEPAAPASPAPAPAPGAGAAEPGAGPKAGAAPEPERPFAWSVARVAVDGLRVEWGDRVPSRPVALVLDPVSLQVDGLSSDPASRWPVAFGFGWSGGGKASLRGAVAPFQRRGEARLDVEALGLAPVSPYLTGPLRLDQGRLTVKGSARFGGPARAGAGTPVAFQGEVHLDGLRAADPASGEERLRWRSLDLLGMDVSTAPVAARLRTVRLVEPRLLVVRAEGPAPGEGRPATAAARPAARGPAEGPKEPAPRIAVGTLRVERGRVSFVDRTMAPPVVLDTTDIAATVTNLSTRETERSAVEARMQVLGAAPLSIEGTVNPLQTGAFTDMTVRSKAIDLTPLGPYFARYAGYDLAKGKLDLDVRVRIDDRALRGENVARVDQLTLGDKVDSPDATALPVKLGLAVLTDRDGVILLDLPVEGRIDDPDFHVGRVVWRALVNVFTKVATSPFAALAALAGGGSQDLSVVELAPGEVEPGEEGSKRVAALARALADRPALGLEIEATTDEADRTALQRRAWEEQRRAAAEKGGGKAAGDAAKPLAPEEEAKLVAAVPIPPEALRALAAQRAERIRAALLAAGVDPSRLFLVQGGERARKEKGSRVYFTLR